MLHSQRERERESNPQLESLQNSVIASEAKPERGKTRRSRSFFSNLNGVASDLKNAQLATTRDCHADLVKSARNDENSAFASNSRGLPRLAFGKSRNDKKTRDCHENPCGFSRNDENTFCHTERSEVSQGNTNRDISAFSKPQYDKEKKPQYDNKKKCVSTPKRVSLSLATSALLAAVSLDMLVAACYLGTAPDGSTSIYRSHQVICTGNVSNDELTKNTNVAADSNFYWGAGGARQLYRVDLGTSSDLLTLSEAATLTLQTNLSTIYLGRISAPSLGLTSSIQNANLYSSGQANISSLSISGSGWNSIHIGNASNIGTLTLPTNAIITTATIDGGARVGNKLSGTIHTLSIGNANFANSGLLTDFSSVTINTRLNIYNASITLAGSANSWNNGNKAGEHILVGSSMDNKITVSDDAIYVSAGDDIEVNGLYKYENIIKNGTSAVNVGLNSIKVKAAPGQAIKDVGGVGFSIIADIASSYGASVYRSLVLSNLRRNTMTQNILDTMTTKTFHSDRFYNQEVELRLLQYDMSRLTNRSSKFSKQTRKNTKKIDKVRERIAKLTLEQSKGQNLDKGYNNFEVIDQLDAIFIPYTGRRDWRFFALPYGTYSYVDLGTSTAQEAAGGALFGMQRNLRANGILGSYIGYEFTNTDTMVADIVPARVQTNSLQAGINYYKTFSVPAKVWEGFIKANIRGGVDLPQLRMNAGPYNLSLSSDKRKGKSTSTIPLMYNIGAELKGGVTFYQFKRNSYISPAVSLSYDMLSSLASKIDKPIDTVGGASYRPLGASEYYDTTYWHLPQLGVDVRYYKMWGNTFRTNLKAGMKYNMLYKQQAKIQFGQTGNLKQTGIITLPVVYGNVAFDLIWMVKKNHELSFGLDALLYASSFAKNNQAALSEWFNGVSGTANFKYAYWFGGTDYVTDKDGNAVARSIAEGGKKSKKSKKPKKKKTKKKKSKVVYIDG